MLTAVISLPRKPRQDSRFECEWLSHGVGFAIAGRRFTYARFRYELLLVLGPLAFTLRGFRGNWR